MKREMSVSEMDAVNKMRNTCFNGEDEEMNHIKADRILCDFLSSLGYVHLVETYKEIDKWYA